MRINVLQHTPNEGPGAILDWAQRHHHTVYTYHPYQFDRLPTIEETDMLVVLGGPMSPNDAFPWLVQERQLIRQARQRELPVFGVCLGAQQIVKAFGGQVQTAPIKEVGWAPVARQTTLIPGLPANLTVLHWHQDMFTLPTDSHLLFSNANLTNQGFLLGHHVVGLQFHLEPLADNVREMVVNDAHYARDSALHQTNDDILDTPVPVANQRALDCLLDYIV